jgi:hypothetical protein
MAKVLKLDRHCHGECKKIAKKLRARAIRRAGKRLDDAKKMPYAGWVS